MLKTPDQIQLSASDLTGHLNCRHLTALDIAVVGGAQPAPKTWDPLLEVLWERGALHERNYSEHLKKAGYSAVEICGVGITEALAQQTLHAMKTGAEIII